MNSSMATTHSQMAEMERIDQECRTTTGARVKGARPQGGAGAGRTPAPTHPTCSGAAPLTRQPTPSSATPPRHSEGGPPCLPSVSSRFPNNFPLHFPPVCGSIPTVSKMLLPPTPHGVLKIPSSLMGAQTVKNPPAMWETRVQSLGWEDLLEEGVTSTPVFLPGESHGQRSLAGPQGHSQTRLSD